MLVSKTIAKYFYDMQILDDLRTAADVLMQLFRLTQIAVLTVAKVNFLIVIN
jgi:hypothetical protein